MYRLVLCCLVSVLAGGGVAHAASPNEIKVSGEGVVKATPDMAAFDVEVSATSKTAEDASIQAKLMTQKMIADLRDAGVKKDELATDDVTVSVYYDKDRERIAGYKATNSLTVTVCDIKDAGKLMDVAVKAGGSSLGRLRKGLKDDTKQMDEARVLAVKNARKKAEVYAAAAGAKVGKVKSIEEGYAYRQPRGVMYQTTADFRGGGDTPVEPGVVAVSASVNVVFELITD